MFSPLQYKSRRFGVRNASSEKDPDGTMTRRVFIYLFLFNLIHQNPEF